MMFTRMERTVGRIAQSVVGRMRYLVLIAWVVGAALLTVFLPSATKMEAQNPADLPANAPSVVASRIDQKAFGTAHDVPAILVFYRKGGLTAVDNQQIATFLARNAQTPLPMQVGASPLAKVPPSALPSLASKNHTTLAVPLLFEASGNSKALSALLQEVGSSLKATFGSNLIARPTTSNNLVARFTGPEGIAVDAAGLFKDADVTLLAGTVLLILFLLILIYRSPILPWVPLLSVGLAYTATSAILGELARVHAIVIDAETVSIMTVLMFGAGTDYTLLVIARYREALYHHADHLQALREALGNAAGAVAMSAGTVMAALLTLLLAVYGSDHRFAIPFALGVGMTAVSSLTAVPALLALLGRHAFYPFVPRPEQSPRAARGGILTRAAVAHPWGIAVGATAILLALAAFAPQIRTSYDL